jgi:hypothetical protein
MTLDPNENGAGYRAARLALSLTLAKVTESLLPARTVSRLRARREWDAWTASLTNDLFEDVRDSPLEIKRELFRRNVNLVEVEMHARCNRVCPFCPNSIVDRRRNYSLTDASLLDRIFRELGSIDYRKQIKVARYSEPLSNLPLLYERIATARKLVPNAELAVVTNTDYLTPAVLQSLRDAGLNTLYMSIYLRSKDTWSPAVAREYSDKLGARLGVRRQRLTETSTSVRCTFRYEGINLYSACLNFDEYGTDRGNIMEQYATQPRAGPCREPFETFVIDYTGAVMPCCNLRSDIPSQRDFIVGDLSAPGSSIFDIYAGSLSAWRRSMIGFGGKESPCTTCTHRDVPKAISGHVARSLETRLHRINRR